MKSVTVWSLFLFVIGIIINEHNLIDAETVTVTNPKTGVGATKYVNVGDVVKFTCQTTTGVVALFKPANCLTSESNAGGSLPLPSGTHVSADVVAAFTNSGSINSTALTYASNSALTASPAGNDLDSGSVTVLAGAGGQSFACQCLYASGNYEVISFVVNEDCTKRKDCGDSSDKCTTLTCNTLLTCDAAGTTSGNTTGSTTGSGIPSLRSSSIGLAAFLATFFISSLWLIIG